MAAVGLAPLIAPLLVETSPREPAVYVVVILVLLSAALVATIAPAQRATRIDPVNVLREDQAGRTTGLAAGEPAR